MTEKEKAKRQFRRALEAMGGSMSFSDVERMVRDGLRKLVKRGPGEEDFEYLWPTEVYPDFVIYQRKGKYFKRAYSILDGNVNFGETETEVQQTWIAVAKDALQEALRELDSPPGTTRIHEDLLGSLQGLAVESEDDGSPVVRGVTLIEACESRNKRRYSREVLERDGPTVFENTPAYVTNHVREQKNLNTLVGAYKDVRWDAPSGRLLADLHGLTGSKETLEKAVEAAKMFGHGAVGLSIDTSAKFSARIGGRSVQEVERLVRTPHTSVDIVINPAAGGRLSESLREESESMNLLARLTEALLAGLSRDALQLIAEGMSDEEVRESNPALADRILAKLHEAAAPPAGTTPSTGSTQETVASPAGAQTITEASVNALLDARVDQRVTEALRRIECRDLLARRLNEANLGAVGCELVRRRFMEVTPGGEAIRTFEAAELDREIAAARDLVGRSFPNRPFVPGSDPTASVTDSFDKQRIRLLATAGATLEQIKEAIPAAKPEDAKKFRSLTQALLAFHPEDQQLYVENPNWFARESMQRFQWGGGPTEWYLQRAQEASLILSSGFSYAWADALNRMVLANTGDPDLNTWRVLVSNEVNFKDLSTSVKLITVGEFTTMESIPEGAAYPELNKPTDRQQTVTPSKYGGIFGITWEARLRDDVGILSLIPRNLGRAVSWTKYDLVYGLLRVNSGAGQTMSYDSTSLYDTSAHANLASLAFSAANVETVRKKMVVQVDPGSGKRKGYKPRFLLFQSPDLDQSTWETLMSNYKIPGTITDAGQVNLPNFIRDFLKLEPIPVQYPSVGDSSIYPSATTTRWEIAADPRDAPTLAVGSLNGQEEPDILVQDQETVGSPFTSDTVNFKTRFTFGQAVPDHRGWQRGNT